MEKDICDIYKNAVLLPLSLDKLEKLRNLLVVKSNISICITGYTDNLGTSDYNINLSIGRANAVYMWLIEHGIDKTQIQVKGYGDKKQQK